MATWGRPVTGHGRSERVTRDSETTRLPHVRPGGRHLESLNPPAFHRRITLLKPRHFAPPSQALTPSPRKPCPGAPQTCSTPDSHCPNIQNLRALFFNHLQLFTPESPKSPLYPQSRTGWGTPWVRLPPSEALHPKLASFHRPPFSPRPSRWPPRRIPAAPRLSFTLPLPYA